MEDFAPMTEALTQRLDYDSSVLRHFPGFVATTSEWMRIVDYPHRFGLQQTAKQLSSFSQVFFYVTKSFCNYLLNKQTILPTSDMKVIQRIGKESSRDITGLLSDFDYNHTSLHFMVETTSYLRYFQGTIHYGDIVRRFGLQCLNAQRNLEINDSWSAKIVARGTALFALLDLISESGVGVSLIGKDGEVLVSETSPGGRNCVILYIPKFFPHDELVELRISGAAAVNEIIFGILP
jgi:hypothetical protein